MVVKIYISGISGNKEVKKRQQRVLMILESKNVPYEVIDITEPGKEAEKEFMQNNSNARESKYPLPPQLFNDEDYCGDYEDFDMANEIDELEKFLKVSTEVSTAEITLGKQTSPPKDSQQNGNTSSREPSTEKVVETDEEKSNERRSSTNETAEINESNANGSDAVETVDTLESPQLNLDDAKDSQEGNTELTEDTVEKNEEKSDDQEKEE